MAAVSLLYSMAVTGWTVLRFTRAASLRPFEFVDLVGWLMFLPLVVLLPLALVLRRWRALAFLLVPAVFFSVEYGPQFWPNLSPPGGGAPLRVATANLLFANEDVDGIVEVLEELDADVVALHELNAPMGRALASRMRERYPFRRFHPQPHALGMGVMSRLRLDEVYQPRLGRDECSCHLLTTTVGDQRITILNAHPLPPGSGPRSFDPQRQARTVAKLLERIEEVEGPLVVVGDMNVGDRHRFYRDFRRHLGDAHRDAGSGFGFTWRAPRPFVRIDYVLRSYHWGTRESHAGTMPGSDHRYVYADLVLLQDP